MKFQQLVMLAVLLVLVLSNTYEDNNEGLCLSDSSKNCSDTVQKYGVCCDQGGTPKWIYYRNYCLACRDGCVTFRVINVKGATCESLK